MKFLLDVFIKFEHGNGDFRTVLDFFCESFNVIGPGIQINKNTKADKVTSVYRFNNIFDKDPFLTTSDYRPISEVMKTDNNKDIFDYWQNTDEDKINNWNAQIDSNYVTTIKIEPIYCDSDAVNQ